MHFYLLLVSSSKGSFGEESLEIGLLPLIWGRGTHEKDQISLAETGRCIAVVWGEERGSKEGLSKVYDRGDSSGKPSPQDSASGFGDCGAIGKGARDVLGGGGADIGCLHIGHFQDFAKKRPRGG